ncbi:zinc finger MYM-type protein 5-like [Aphis craccivora]|uniref:Zinc finger MYM-type protein 5-like n=1 Tax=Aphis craccivora TaxID=307492 RepID=A0A6G0Y5F7_APHCR|nr:zinc finger MYM-type protein 5-like [Aphis craccivora]
MGIWCASKRKRKAEMMQVNQAMSTSMMKFLNKTSTSTTTDLDEPNIKMDLNEGNLSNNISKYNEEMTKEVETKSDLETSPPINTFENKEITLYVNSNINNICDLEMHKQEIVLSEPLMSLDPGKWVFPLSGSQRHDLVQHGPQQMLEICDENYPLDNNKRHFSNFHYTRKLSNRETQHRRWLFFSNLQTQMIREGCCDWKHLSTILQRHEKSQEHMVCMIKWVEFDKRIKLGKKIDRENEKRICESQKHWYNLFKKLINVINFLASHNLSFRGHRESIKLDDSNNSGNFIDLLKLLSKYDHSLQNHFQLINEKKLAQHYLSHDIQNELIKLMSKKVIEEIIIKVKLVKYYAFMLDCTRDISRVEQMSIILRFCNTSTGDIEEHFIGFIAVDSTTGEHLTNIILHELKSNGLDIQDCRGQGFDNGANMVGINKGVKTRILNINPKAFFAPCGCHSWNLILVDAVKSSITAKTFFGFIQKIYLLFSKSSKRWDLIKDKLKLTLKSLSETRWESRIAAVKAILFQFDDIIDCINILKMQIVDAETLCDCEAILKEMLTFEFIVAIHVWYEILLRVNNISKIWQSVQVNLKMAVDSLNNFCNWIQEYRDIGFNKSIIESRQFIEKSSYEIELNFKNKRIAKKKKCLVMNTLMNL